MFVQKHKDNLLTISEGETNVATVDNVTKHFPPTGTMEPALS